jgi:diguanylate cyclase (GGDEF)-like protein
MFHPSKCLSGEPILIEVRQGITRRASSSSREKPVRDELTELLNPDAFRLLVEHELLVARRLHRVDTLLVIDVDNLRSVNESFGNDGGDETLRAIARLLRRTARDSDIIARLGGDEFAVFALGCAGDALANRISAAVACAADSASEATIRELSVGMSIGITEVRPGERFDELMARGGPVIFQRVKAEATAT